MAIKDILHLGLLFIVAIEVFAVWLKMRAIDSKARRRNVLLDAVLVHMAARAPAEPHTSMMVPAVAAVVPAGWGQRKPVDVTRDDDTDPDVLGASPRPPYSANTARDDEDDTILMTKAGQGAKRPMGRKQ